MATDQTTAGDRVASPASTGLAGADFEHTVQAAFLATMLVRGQMPCLPRGTVDHLCLQAEHLGYATDDLLVSVSDAGGSSSRLIAQIKQRLSFAAGDDEFCKTLVEAWQDFCKPELFTKNRDALAVITGPGADKSLRHLRPMLSYAKHSASSSELLNKLDAYSKQKRAYYDLFKSILSTATPSPCDADLYEFLRHLHWLPYDLDDAAQSSHLALVLNMIELGKAPDSPEPGLIWGRIKDFISDTDKNAGTITREQLPPDLRDYFMGTQGVLSSDSLGRLQERTTVILDGFRNTIAGRTHIERPGYRALLTRLVEDSPFVILSGGAGAGKSALAKEVLHDVGKRIPVFSIKSDELDCAVLDRLFTAAGVSETLSGLSARFAMLGRKVLYIDALERILEFSDQDVLQQLIEFVHRDPTWTVFATARTLSLSHINTFCFAPAGVRPLTISVNPLTDDELAIVAREHPGITALLDNQKIKSLLRVPLYLSFACLVDWKASDYSADAIDEMQLREILWGAIVENRRYQSHGFPLRRAETFVSLARDRSTQMRPFVAPRGIDAEALDLLIKDELVVAFDGQYAPAHDLLEEWALQRYIGHRFGESGGQPNTFLESIGTSPAMRRSLRLWLSDRLTETGDTNVQRFAFSCLGDASIPQYWRDEITIAVLNGHSAEAYLETHKTEIMADDASLLVRILHLLRIACRQPDIALLHSLLPASHWTQAHDVLSTAFLKASGRAWAAVIDFLSRNRGYITPNMLPSVAGVIDDWVSGLDFQESGDTARSAGLLCLDLLGFTADYRHKKHQEPIAKALLKVAPAVANELKTLLDTLIARPFRERRDYDSLLDSALNTLWNDSLCKVLPGSVVAIARAQWFLTEEEAVERGFRGVDIDVHFGMRKHWAGNDGITASALYGPFSSLLKHHPAIALPFIQEVVNRASDFYAVSRLDFEPSERDEYLVAISLADGSSRDQWLNGRLWQAYRGSSVAPRLLQSALMALEDWLLKRAEDDREVREPFEGLLADTNSCAMSAVLVSLAIAHPDKLGEALLPLFRVPQFFQIDLARQVQEQTHIVDFGDYGWPSIGWDKIYVQERKSSQRREHRKYSLEDLARKLQFTELREKIWDIFDKYYEELPPADEQTEWHRTWRIALLRLDMRKHKAEADADGKRIIFTPPEPEPELKKIQEDAAENHARMSRFVSLMTWGSQRFRRENMESDPFPTWQSAYSRALEIEEYIADGGSANDLFLYGECPLWCAAVLVRDFWADLPPDVRKWCAEHIRQAVVVDADGCSAMADTMISAVSAKAAAAYILPAIAVKLPTPENEAVRVALCTGLCHESDVIRAHIACGIRDFIWQCDAEFALQCFRGMLEWAKLQVDLSTHYHMLYSDDAGEHRKAINNARADLRQRVLRGETCFPPYPATVEIDAFSTFVLRQVILTVPRENVPGEVSDFCRLLLSSVLQYADAHENRRGEPRNGREYHFEFAHEFRSAYAQFILGQGDSVLRTAAEELAAATNRVPEFVGEIVDELVRELDRREDVADAFWYLWLAIKDEAVKAIQSRRSYISAHHGCGKLLRSLILMGIRWKDSAREWKPLTAHAQHLEELYPLVGSISVGFSAYVYLMDSIGSIYLPRGLKWLAGSLAEGTADDLLGDDNTAFLLERIIRNLMFDDAKAIRQDRSLQDAVLTLLEGLIAQGSSGAFLLRERLIGLHCSLRFD